MSTRCNIIVKDTKTEYQLYHHYDGYPEGVGEELKIFLNTEDFSQKAETFASELEKWDHCYENEGEGRNLHSDIEYLYTVDLTQGLLTCTDLIKDTVEFEYPFYIDEDEDNEFIKGYRKGIEKAIECLKKLLD